jgi:type IV pilus assembly protein PilE
MTQESKVRGFTLVEVMVVVAIVGILSAIALPSYNSYIVRSSRAAAQTELLTLVSLQEKIYLNSSFYSCSITLPYNGKGGCVGNGLGLTSGTTTDGKYTITITSDPNNAAAPQTYIITATPVIGQSQASDSALTVDQAGNKTWGSKTW